jgi:hypothetical protein
MGAPLVLDRVTALDMDPQGRVDLHGAVTTSVDGSTFDAAFQWDGLASGACHPGGLFDFAAGGLRLVEQRVESHDYVLVATGDPAPGCLAAGAASPCLVPRLAILAHDRLRTVADFEPTLTGHVAIDESAVAVPAAASEARLGPVVAVAAVLAALIAVARLARFRARSPLGQVRTAGQAALAALRGDVTLEKVADHVRAMMARARELDAARRSFARRLRRIDRGSIERRRQASAQSDAPGAGDALQWLDEESAEVARLECDLASTVVGLERLASALRVVTLRVRENRDTRARARRSDPVDALARELAVRDAAQADVESALGS